MGPAMIGENGVGVLQFSDILDAEYREAPPPPGLEGLVECLWVAGRAGADPENDRRILPDGRMDLVWVRGSEVLVAGPQTRFTKRPFRFPIAAVGVRFRPGAAPSLLRLPAAEFVDGHVPLAAVAPAMARRLEPRLEAAESAAEALAVMAGEIGRRADELAAPDEAVFEAATLLDDPSANVAEVATHVYVSERQLRRRFAERIGYGPKTLQRVLRFQRVKSLVEAPGTDLARAGLAAGYADQAHFTRECRELSGLTPTQLARWLGGSRPANDAAEGT